MRIDPRPVRDAPIGQVCAGHRALRAGVASSDRVRVTGSLLGIRRHGGISFGRVRDGTGTIQVVADRHVLGPDRHRAFDRLSAGDRVTVEGDVMTTRRGELSVRVAEFETATEDETSPEQAPPEAAAGGSPATASHPPHPPPLPDGACPAPEGPPPPDLFRPRGRVVVRLIAALTALGGVVELAASVPAGRTGAHLPPTQLDSEWGPVAGHLVSVVAGLLLFLLAGQLGTRKRAAWRLALLCFAVGAAASMARPAHPVSAGFCLAMLAALLLARRQFDAPADPPSLPRLLRFVPLYLVAVLVFGFAGLLLERNRIDPALTLGGGLQTIFAGLVGMDGAYTYHSSRFALVYPAALLTLGSAGLAIFLVLLFRPLTARPVQSVEDWHHARQLVRAHGWDTLAYFALRRDKSFFFGSDGQAMIAYTYLNGYALVSGDPIGAQGSVSRVVDEFLAMCSRRAWKPAFLAIRERDLPFYAARGFHSFYLGDEAVLRCDTFHTTGRARKSLRAAVRRVGRRYTFRMIPETSASPELVAGLNTLSAKWRGKAPERGFTMSLGQAFRGISADPEVLLCVALDADGRPGGFLRIVPAHGPGPGYTLDLMRHDPDAPNGMTEYLLASTATALAGRGVVRLSMNFALWGRLFSHGPLTVRQRLARYAVGVLNPFFQIKSLRDFNAKFGPEWVPRRLVYRRPTDLPRIGLLYAGAERLLTIPGLGELFVPEAGRSVTPPAGEPVGTSGAGTLDVRPRVP